MWQRANWKDDMKKKPSTTLNVSRNIGCIVALISIPLLLAMLIPPVSSSTFCFAIFVLTGMLVAGFLADHFTPARITLTDSEVQLRIRRTKEIVTFPWSNFTCLYTLSGHKMTIYLLTPAPMDKASQLATYKACCKNKSIPYTHEGCLILNAYIHGDVIDQYIPANLKKASWHHCAKL